MVETSEEPPKAGGTPPRSADRKRRVVWCHCSRALRALKRSWIRKSPLISEIALDIEHIF
jgi:hypothetical protein